MSLVRSLINKAFGSVLEKEEQKQHIQGTSFPNQEIYSLSDPRNMNSTLEKESRFLISIFNRIRYQINNNSLNLTMLSKEELAVLSECKISLRGHYAGYLPIGVRRDYLIVETPRHKLRYNEDGSISEFSEAAVQHVYWNYYDGYIDVSLPCVLPALRSLALVNHFFSSMPPEQLNTVLEDLIKTL